MRALRVSRGMTQQEMADRVGVTLRAYQHYEAGRRQPKMADAPTIAGALGVPVAALYEETPAQTPGEFQPTGADRMFRDFIRIRLGLDEHAAGETLEAFLQLATALRPRRAPRSRDN